ncbi:hypothetical protein ACQ4PT_055877 [Festuca glaucescens]
MADPSYLQSVTLSQETQFKEFLLHLYLYRNGQAQPEGNQAQILGSTSPHGFGCTVVNDWTMHDAPSPTATIVAHAQGLHLQASINGSNWFVCHNIVFIDDRFKGSTLKVLGNMGAEEGEWAIIGGSGEFAYAQGVVTYKPVNRELHIRVLCLTFPKLAILTDFRYINKRPTTSLNKFINMLLRDMIQAPAVPTSTAQTIGLHGADVQAPNVPALHVQEVEVPGPKEPASEVQVDPVVPAPTVPASEVLAPVVPSHVVPYHPQENWTMGCVISLLEIAYYNQSGVERSASWGGRPLPGSQSEQMVLQPGELVKNVSGTTQFYDGSVRISSLTFVTTVRTYGPFGPEGSHSSFSSPELDDNSSIVGFFGQHTSFGSQAPSRTPKIMSIQLELMCFIECEEPAALNHAFTNFHYLSSIVKTLCGHVFHSSVKL